MTDLQQALPLYILRESPRAKNVRLNVTPAEGLVVVIPRKFNLKRLPGILEEKREWIENALRWADEQRTAEPNLRRVKVPSVIFLQSVGETWDVIYQPTDSLRTSTKERRGDVLAVSGRNLHSAASVVALKRWLGRKSRRSLIPVLRQLSDQSGLAFNNTMVGNQRTRWASCSPAGTISLNQKMLFLPERLVRYIFVHELCHTVHLNHSRRFWSLVSKYQPDYRQLDGELRAAGRFVPPWAE